MDECRYRRRTLHGIGQPDVQREHGRLTGTTDEHQHQCGRNDKATGSHSLGDITLDERCRPLPHHDIPGKRETERIDEVAEGQDTHEEEHIGKAGDDERFLRGSDGRLQRIVESNEQIGRDTYEFPEHIHLEDIGGEYQTQHRHREETQESVITLEALLPVHIAE